MNKRDKSKLEANKYILWVVPLLLLSVLPLFSLLRINFDSLKFNYLPAKELLERPFELLTIQARPAFVVPFAMVIEYANAVPFGFWAAGYVILLGIGAYLAVEAITTSRTWGMLTGILTVTLYSINLEPITVPTGYPFYLGWIAIATSLFAIAFALRYNTTGKTYNRILSIVCIMLSMFSYEVGVLLLPVIIGINLLYRKSFKISSILRYNWDYILSGLLYCAAFVAMKMIYGAGEYEGAHIASLNIWSFIVAYVKNFVSNIPGYFFLHSTSSAYGSVLSYATDYSYESNLAFFAKNFINLSILVSLCLFVYLVWKLLRISTKETLNSVPTTANKFALAFACFLCAYSIIIPTVPSCLTQYTQEQIETKWRLVVVGNQYSYYAIIITAVLLIWRLSRVVNKKWACAVICCVLTVQFGMVLITNQTCSKRVNWLGSRFEQIESIAVDMSQYLPDGAYIYSPSLFQFSGVFNFRPYVYNNLFKYYTSKNINIVSRTEDLPQNKDVPLFYVNYQSTYENKNSIFALSHIEAEQLQKYENYQQFPLLTDELVVYTFTPSKNSSITGFLNADNKQMITCKVDEAFQEQITADGFRFAIDKNAERHKYQKAILSSENIDVSSITLNTDTSYSMKNSPFVQNDNIYIGGDYWNDGWAGENLAVLIKTGSSGIVELSGAIAPNTADNIKISAYIGDLLVEELAPSGGNFTFDVDTGVKNDWVELNIKADFSVQNYPDVRKLSYLVKNIYAKNA